MKKLFTEIVIWRIIGSCLTVICILGTAFVFVQFMDWLLG